tara:strand:- start:1126 stop:1557 length:432 start_codon:yes stop_codon:yes gene_type:complete
MTLPRKSTLFKCEQRDKDARGEILSIVDAKIQNVSIITSTPDSLRSNHYHHKDFHFMYVFEGEIDYFYKDIDNNKTEYIKVKKGDNIFTPRGEIHAAYFAKPTTLIVSSKHPRDQKTYESDTVRIKFISAENIQETIKKYAKE